MSVVRHVPALLILLAVAALATEHGSHYPIAILFLLGLVQWIRAPRTMHGCDGARLFDRGGLTDRGGWAPAEAGGVSAADLGGCGHDASCSCSR